jgi:hypothetical protein
MDRFSAVEGYCDEGYFDRGGDARRRSYLDPAFYSRLYSKICISLAHLGTRASLNTYQCRRYAWVSDQEVAVWRATDPHEGRNVRLVGLRHGGCGMMKKLMRVGDHSAVESTSAVCCSSCAQSQYIGGAGRNNVTVALVKQKNTDCQLRRQRTP